MANYVSYSSTLFNVAERIGLVRFRRDLITALAAWVGFMSELDIQLPTNRRILLS